jgi:hypothetical protein
MLVSTKTFELLGRTFFLICFIFMIGASGAWAKLDVNQDLEVTVIDAMLTLRRSLNLNMEETSWQEAPSVGDANCDGSLGSTDAMLLLQKSLNLSVVVVEQCSQFNQHIEDALLQEQYNNLEYHWVDKEDSLYYTKSTDGMVFSIEDDNRIRCELRTFLDNEWPLAVSDRSIIGSVALSNIGTDVETFTFLQLHHKDGERHPFIRFAWQRDNNLLKVVVRNDDTDGGHTNYFFGTLNEGEFFPVEIRVNENDLHIAMNGVIVDTAVPSYWKTQQKFYFKAGLYFGISSQFYKEAKVHYKSLSVYGDF